MAFIMSVSLRRVFHCLELVICQPGWCFEQGVFLREFINFLLLYVYDLRCLLLAIRTRSTIDRLTSVCPLAGSHNSWLGLPGRNRVFERRWWIFVLPDEIVHPGLSDETRLDETLIDCRCCSVRSLSETILYVEINSTAGVDLVEGVRSCPHASLDQLHFCQVSFLLL